MVTSHSQIKLFFFLLLNLFPTIKARGSCSEAALCCPGRDSSCVVQKTPMNKFTDLDDEPCYCDHACMKLRDCCHDYKEMCRVTDCKVTHWGRWSWCNADCGSGIMTRQRRISQQPQNGGKRCPEVVQKRGCLGNECNVRNTRENVRLESALLLTGKFASMRTMNESNDIRKNLRLQYPEDASKERSKEYCVVFEITKSKHKCVVLGDASKSLHKGKRVCVACEATAMRKYLGYRCNGHGIESRSTRWAALEASHCHGRWVRLSTHNRCPCHADGSPDFIFV
ncbi:somatomedin-B and thrombospondin type-1 domain-containing protein-like [Tachypleus tridentatus]|uniref:somatomedin-B and thrombospondin type-1 domain-containing protein-like n=1 Tax=Tachypleus tridentatus TaxID=6853 RepID=UPI003FD40088